MPSPIAYNKTRDALTEAVQFAAVAASSPTADDATRAAHRSALLELARFDLTQR